MKSPVLRFVVASVQTQSPVLQGKMLVPMATVRTAPAPAPQFPIVAPPLPVQNGAQTGSKVRRHFSAMADTSLTRRRKFFPTGFSSVSVSFMTTVLC